MNGTSAGLAARAACALVLLLSGCATAPPAGVETVSAEGGRVARAPARPPAADDPMSLGSPAAPVALVEYSDYQCPFCRRFHEQVLPQLRREYIDTGKLILVYRDLPLGMHREAMPAALAARCAAREGKFWPMNEALFANQSRLGPALYARLAGQLGLNAERFRACLADPATRQLVRADIGDAQHFNIRATPGFILGRFDGGGLRVERVAIGLVDFDTLAREIDALIAGGAQAP